MIFYDFQEFVTYPLDRERVRTRAERLDTSKAFRRNTAGEYPEDYSPSSDRGAVVDFDLIVRNDDEFECMDISDYGDVQIWTKKKVWLLLRKETAGLEKLIYVDRHPPQNAA